MPPQKAETWLQRHIVDCIGLRGSEFNNLVCFMTQQNVSAVSNRQSVVLATAGFIVQPENVKAD